MKKIKIKEKKNGFFGEYYITNKNNTSAIIVILGNEEAFIKAISKHYKAYGLNILGIYPYEKEKRNRKFVKFPIEKIQKAVNYLLDNNITKIGIAGGSTWSTLTLTASSLIPEISLSLAFSPCDYVLEGTYLGKKKGMKEWPSVGVSSLSYKDEEIPFVSFNLEEKDYWKACVNEQKKYKEPHMRDLYDSLEEQNPVKDEAFIKIENINGTIVLVGAKDDSMWDSTRYIDRMEERLKNAKFKNKFVKLSYEVGTHFLFPRTIFKNLSALGGELLIHRFKSGKKNLKKCKEVQMSLDYSLDAVINEWISQ